MQITGSRGPSPDLVAQIAGRLTVLKGPNFSGRTAALRSLAGVDEPGPGTATCAYVGPEIHNSLSGLASTVSEEIALHLGDAPHQIALVDDLVAEFRLRELLNRNPFTLSGGEQALTALASALAMRPSRLALDCCLEQLDRDYRELVLSRLAKLGKREVVAFADNRLDEYPSLPEGIVEPPFGAPEPKLASPQLHPIRDTPPASTVEGHDLSLEGLQFGYPRSAINILADASISLERGNAYILEGRNGAGKSTLAKILCGALRPQHGLVRLGSRTIAPWQRPGRAVAYHFQNPDLQLFSTSVIAEISAGTGALRAEAVDLEWLEAFGLTAVAKTHPLDLPFVGRKRVALAASFAMSTPWLVLDEPTLGQDLAASSAIASMVRMHVAAGRGAIVITHSRRFAELIEGRRLLLQGGRIHDCI